MQTGKNKAQKIIINLPNGYKLVAKQNPDPAYKNEIFIGVLDPDCIWCQDLAIVRNGYSFDSETGDPVWKSDRFEILVYADKDNEDYTNEFVVGLFTGGV